MCGIFYVKSEAEVEQVSLKNYLDGISNLYLPTAVTTARVSSQ